MACQGVLQGGLLGAGPAMLCACRAVTARAQVALEASSHVGDHFLHGKQCLLESYRWVGVQQGMRHCVPPLALARLLMLQLGSCLKGRPDAFRAILRCGSSIHGWASTQPACLAVDGVRWQACQWTTRAASYLRGGDGDPGTG